MTHVNDTPKAIGREATEKVTRLEPMEDGGES